MTRVVILMLWGACGTAGPDHAVQAGAQGPRIATTDVAHVPGPKGFVCVSTQKNRTKQVLTFCYRSKKVCEALRKAYRDVKKMKVTECQRADIAHCYLVTNTDAQTTVETCFGTASLCSTARQNERKNHKQWFYSECVLTR